LFVKSNYRKDITLHTVSHGPYFTSYFVKYKKKSKNLQDRSYDIVVMTSIVYVRYQFVLGVAEGGGGLYCTETKEKHIYTDSEMKHADTRTHDISIKMHFV